MSGTLTIRDVERRANLRVGIGGSSGENHCPLERALEGFENNRILILINDRQAESLDEEFVIESGTSVTFLRLMPLVGG